MAADGDPQTVEFVKPNILHHPCLSVGKDHDLSDKIGLHLCQSGEDCGRAVFQSEHGQLREQCSSLRLQFKDALVVAGAGRTSVGSDGFGPQIRSTKMVDGLQLAVRFN
jgi:hypothetical protein